MSIFNWLFRKSPSGATPAPRAPTNTAPKQTIIPNTERANNPAPSIARFSENNFRFIALDVETANDDVGSICSVGLAGVGQENQIVPFGSLVDPQVDFADFNINLHGIDQTAVRNAPTFPEFFEPIIPILLNQPLVQHSHFDSRAIHAACEQYGLAVPNLQWIDSVVIARRAWPELRGSGGHGLANLKKALDLDFDHHDAIEDARGAAMVAILAEQATGKTFIDLGKTSRKRNYPAKVTVLPNPEGPMLGHIAVFTGALTMDRQEAATLAADFGIAVKASVTKSTSILIVGDQDMSTLAGHRKSSKHRKAEALLANGQEIQIIGETDFIALIKTGNFQ